MHMFESVFRFLFAWLDKIVGWLIMQGYNMFEIISDINIFWKNLWSRFRDRYNCNRYI